MNKKISIIALHMGYGGVEHAISSLANMLCKNYNVEIISVYKLKNDCPFYLNKEVKVKYLTNDYPNKEQFKQAVNSKRPFSILKEGIKSISILYKRYFYVKKFIKNTDSNIIISTRLLFNSLVGKYHRKGVITISQEHCYHNNNKKYINRLLKSIKNIDYFMPVSKYLTSYYKEQIINRNMKVKCLYINHIIDEIPDKINYQPTKKLFSVGRLEKEKGFLDLIDVFYKIHQKDKEFTLDIFGDGSEKKQIEEKILSYKLKDEVTLHGFTKKEEINNYSKEAGLYIMTSYEESFGLVLIEAMAYGIPCVAFDSAKGACEIINNKNGLLIKNRDFNKMADEIISIFKKKERMLAMSVEARSTCKSYSFAETKSKWLDFIINIIN